ncbi:MAG: formimidoylglutamate deiminase [Proteobacteria bacterium]|nr:formimidoylglutamate deiminase [Pseudomonadota bacterium]MBI3497577.1 formimidoylglutamate deiminase [Pseudomonadota bacterium]
MSGNSPSSSLFAAAALLPEGWTERVRFEIAGDGGLARVTAGASPEGAQRLSGPVIPGMPNVHSHAFQRAMAGLAEHRGAGDDDFWTWRQVMYGFVERLGPDQIEAVAAELYVELLEAGYTAVGEFHYLHHAPDGRAYDDAAELSERIIAAAESTGIGLTLLPVLYVSGGFGAKPAGPAQRRFLNTPDRFLKLAAALFQRHKDDPQLKVGIAPHSLRAVPPAALSEAVAGIGRLDGAAPIHIHVAEQTREVEECLAWSGMRPVEWLLEHQAVDRRWCLVHATHMNEAEIQRLASSGAVAGLCPTTEANLGDGVFPAGAYLAAGGAIGIGSDSHISTSPIEELRWLEYGQRLVLRRRNLLGSPGGSVGAALYRRALAGGAQALARPIGRLAPGARADLVVLDPESPTLAGKTGDRLLDALVFAGNANPVKDVMVGGRWQVRDGRHLAREPVRSRFRRTMQALGV